jgi:hypothetical protein
MSELLSARTPWRIGAGAALGIGSLLFTAGAVEGSYNQRPTVEVEAGQGNHIRTASVGAPILADTCLVELMQPGLEDGCEVPETVTIPSLPEVTVPPPEEIVEKVQEVVPPTTTPSKPRPTTTTAPPPPPQQSPPISGHKMEWLKEAGVVAESDYGYVDYIFIRESGSEEWKVDAENYKGCIGLGQNCPDDNGRRWLQDSCPNWQSDPVCQIRRFHEYAIGRYKSWKAAYDHKKRYGWW